MSREVSVAKNTFNLTVATIFQKILTTINSIFIARVYGDVNQGRFASAIAFTTLFSVMIDLGVAAMLTREMARDREGTTKKLGMIFFVRLLLAALVYLAMIAIAHVGNYPSEMISIIYVTGLVAVLDSLSTFCWFVLRGLHSLKYESIAVMFTSVIMVGLSLLAIAFNLPIIYLAVAMMFASASNFLYGFSLVLSKVGMRFTYKLSLSFLREFFTLVLPFALAAIFSRIYTFLDQTLLIRLGSEAQAGWYSVANKLVLALQFFPAAMSAAIMPAMTAYYAAGKPVGDLFARSFRYLFLLVLPIAIGAYVLATPLIVGIYGNGYAEAADSLRVLTVALVCAFLMFPLGALLVAVNRQAGQTKILFCAALVNIVGNIILIPRMQAVGAAITSSITYALIFVAQMVLTYQYWSSVSRKLVVDALKITLSALVMGLIVWFLREQTSIIYSGSAILFTVFAIIPLAIVVYVAMILVTKVVSTKELSTLRSSIKPTKSAPVDPCPTNV